MKWIDEIKEVGFSDWIWFVYWIKRDEFHPRLYLGNYFYHKDLPSAQSHCASDRRRAHLIDMKLTDMKLTAQFNKVED